VTAPRPNRKSEKPLICFIRLYGTEKKRMENVCRKFSTDHNAVAKAGIGAEIFRLESHVDALTPEVARVFAEARALGIDIIATLRERIAQVSP
jgi:CII-binding regulator of phage lambda lysogenization HflD